MSCRGASRSSTACRGRSASGSTRPGRSRPYTRRATRSGRRGRRPTWRWWSWRPRPRPTPARSGCRTCAIGAGSPPRCSPIPTSRLGGGYFLLLAGLPPEPKGKAAEIRREVTLVIDRSGSIRGEKLDQVREAARQVIAGLDEGEAFNLVLYNEGVDPFAPEAGAEVARDRARGAEVPRRDDRAGRDEHPRRPARGPAARAGRGDLADRAVHDRRPGHGRPDRRVGDPRPGPSSTTRTASGSSASASGWT